jgi:hypothetical protein
MKNRTGMHTTGGMGLPETEHKDRQTKKIRNGFDRLTGRWDYGRSI